MNLRIIEQYVEGKLSNELCEDVVHVSENFVAIIDGATSFASYEQGRAPGKVISELIDQYLPKISKELSSRLFAKELSEAVSGALSDIFGSGDEKPTASLIIYSAFHSEIWVLGDGWVRTQREVQRFTIPYADAYTQLRCAYLQALIRDGCSVDALLEEDPSIELILPFIRIQKSIQNRLPSPHGYGVIDGHPSCANYIRTLRVEPGEEIVMASDGYPAIADTLEEAESELKRVIGRDPLMISLYPQAKGVMKQSTELKPLGVVEFPV